ncbi:MAG TPA: hypothetical protein VFH37_03585 [Candidatus Saccharimonadales bacterium]|nr:hypothetical protein [Candidatus Saccharimonadales bacterium]
MEAASIDWQNGEPLPAVSTETYEADQITTLDGIHEGAFAHKFAINGVDSGIAITRECVDPKSAEWTYYFHFDGFEGKYFGEADVQPTKKIAYYCGEAIGDSLKGERAEQAKSLMVVSMILLPLAIKRDFPEIGLIEDSFGNVYDIASGTQIINAEDRE